MFSALMHFASAWSAEEGRSMCLAAQTQMNTLGPIIDQITNESNFSHALHLLESWKEGTLESARARDAFRPIKYVFEDQHKPTEVVRMNLPDWLRDQVQEFALLAKKFETTMNERAGTPKLQGYQPWSLEFENALLFNPSCLDFWNLNEEIIREKFPPMHACDCNQFTVPVGKKNKAYGVHYASNIFWQRPVFPNENWFIMKDHMSFHTAVTPTDIDSSPFTIFEQHVPQQKNFHEVLREVLFTEKRNMLDETSLRRMVFALTMLLPPTKYPDVSASYERTAQDYMNAVDWMLDSCNESNPLSHNGTWWKLDAGDALYFNNWRAHSDNGLGESTKARVTIDMRCYGNYSYIPWPYTDEYQVVMADLEGRLRLEMNEIYLECMLSILNYSSTREFMDKLFAESNRIPPNDKSLRFLLGNIMFGFTSGGDNRIFDKSHMTGLQKHYKERVIPVLKGEVPGNWAAFDQCIDRHRVVFVEASSAERHAHLKTDPINHPMHMLRFMGFLPRAMWSLGMMPPPSSVLIALLAVAGPIYALRKRK